MRYASYLEHWTEWWSTQDMQEDPNLVLADLVVVAVGVIWLLTSNSRD